MKKQPHKYTRRHRKRVLTRGMYKHIRARVHTHTHWTQTETDSDTLNNPGSGGCGGIWQAVLSSTGGWRILGSEAITSVFILSLEKTTSQQARTYGTFHLPSLTSEQVLFNRFLCVTVHTHIHTCINVFSTNRSVLSKLPGSYMCSRVGVALAP